MTSLPSSTTPSTIAPPLEFPTKPPPGYVNDKQTKTIVVDPPTARHVVNTFEMCASGNYTVPRIRDELTRIGFLTKHGKPLSLSKFHYILNNTIYYGPFRYGGELYDGSHPPIITKSLFDAAQKHLRRQERKWSSGMVPFLYRGLIKCAECHATISYEVQKGRGYLRCSKKLNLAMRLFRSPVPFLTHGSFLGRPVYQ
jgi:site-specific DNA recombinase